MTTPLRRVDKLTIQVIVDNSVEWFSTLPPGFTHELPQHLQLHPKVDERTGVPFMDLDNVCCGANGLCMLLTTELHDERHSILFDSGPDARALERNYDSLSIASLESIERVVLSHWHRDHSGGMLTLLEKRPGLTLDLHPDRPIARGMARSPHDKVIARLPDDPTFAELEAAGGRVEKHSEGHAVGGGSVWVSGEIPRVVPFETGLYGAMRWKEDDEGKGAWVSEPHIMDERYAAVDVLGKGLVILSACSHAGIANVVRDAVKTFQRPVYMILGGLHLMGEMEARIPETVKYLTHQLRPAPVYVLPMHCSGFRAKVALENALGEGCVPATVGMKIEVLGDTASEHGVMAPSLVE